MKTRLLSALVIVPTVVAAILFLPSVAMLAVQLAIAAVVMLEFYALLEKAGIPSFRYVGITCGSALLIATYTALCLPSADGSGVGGNAGRAAAWENIVLLLTVFVLMIRQFPQKHNDKPLPTIACTLLGVLYIPFLLSFYTKLALMDGTVGWRTPFIGHTGRYLVLYATAVVKLTDSGALFIGTAIGRHKLFPRLSPGKTWEGLIAGLAFGTATSCIFVSVCHGSLGSIRISLPHAAALGLLLGIAGMLGDMSESLIKRAASAKDSASVVPGIGGMLDVFDSLLFGVPVAYVYLSVMI